MHDSAEPISVLHVDDQPDFTELVASFLERERGRIEVRTATSAQEGLTVLAEHNVDCVVSDYDMPGRTGIEFLRAVRKDHPDLPFVLFTGKGSEEVASDAISAGVTDYLQKGTGTQQYEILANRIENAVEARRARQERQRQLDAIESAREGISLLDEAGKYTYVNQAYADLYGYDPAGMVGESWELIYREDDVGHIREDVLTTVREDGYWHGTTTGLRADGSTFVEDHVLATTGDGELVCTVRDVTEQREREQQLERTYDFFTEAERLGDLGAWEFDESGEATWTDGTRRIFGVDDDYEPTVDNGLEFVHPDDREGVRAAMEAALDSGESYDRRCRVVRPDGTERWVRVIGGPVEENDEPRTIRGFIQNVTEQRERERELERTTARLEALFEHSPDMINVHDEDGTILDPNPRLCEETGYDAETLVGKKVWELNESIDEEGARAHWADLGTDETLTLEGLYRRRDGSTFPVEVHVSRFELAGEDRFVAITRDISRRQEREAELRRAERLFQAVFEDPNILVGHLEIDGTLRGVNETALAYVDVAEDNLIGELFWETPWFTGDPVLQDQVREWIERAADGEYVEFEADLSEAVGEPLVISGVVRPVTDEDGEVVSLLVSDRDVTGRVERERELEQYETVIETIPDGVFIVDEDGAIVLVNDRAADLVGQDPDGLIGDRFIDLVEDGVYDDTLVETYREAVREMLSTESDRETVHVEQRATVDGEQRVHEMHLALRPFESSFRGTIGVVRDVTDQRRQERALRRQNERLERFASIVSHDLRNPLSVAEGQLVLAREDCDSDHLAAIGDAHDRMEALIEDLLALAREGKVHPDIGPVDLGQLVSECWQTIEAADAVLRTADLPAIRADAQRLRQLLENLFRNAVEHGSTSPRSSSRHEDAGEHGAESSSPSPPDGKRAPERDGVTVTVGSLEDGFFVEDDGPGVPPDLREDVFEYGYTTGDGGTGLGLSIVRQVAADHGWSVAVTDGREGGARFEVTGVEFADQ